MALGANIFNMAIVNSVGGYAIYRGVCRLLPGVRGQVTAIAFAGWCATVLAAICCAGELAFSGTVPWTAAFPAMAGTHMLIGVGEGLISALVFLAIQRTRPEMIADTGGPGQPRRWGELVRYGLLVTLGVAIFVAPFACPWPDGLEHVASRLGFEQKSAPIWFHAPAPNYRTPGVHWAVAATAIAGAAGSLIVFALAFWLGRLLAPKQTTEISGALKDA